MITFSLTAVKIGNAGMVGNVALTESAFALWEPMEVIAILQVSVHVIEHLLPRIYLMYTQDHLSYRSRPTIITKETHFHSRGTRAYI